MATTAESRLEICKEAVLAGGNAIKFIPREERVTQRKFDSYFGTSMVGVADYRSQKSILDVIMRRDLGAFFITEEAVNDPEFSNHLIRSHNLEMLKEHGAYVIDELDGTAGFVKGGAQWCISIGSVNEQLKHEAGAIYAPMLGLLNRPMASTLFYAGEGMGNRIDFATRIFENGKLVYDRVEHVEARVTKANSLKEAYLGFGIDCNHSSFKMDGKLIPNVTNKALTDICSSVRSSATTPSCALGLGYLAAGVMDVIIQPVQSVWDWSAGKVIVEQAGGKLHILRDGRERQTGTHRRP